MGIKKKINKNSKVEWHFWEMYTKEFADKNLLWKGYMQRET